MPRFLKGSDEAKEYMKRLRNMKIQKGQGIKELVTTFSRTGDINASRHKSLTEDIKKMQAKYNSLDDTEDEKANKLQQKINFAIDKKDNLYNKKIDEINSLDDEIKSLDNDLRDMNIEYQYLLSSLHYLRGDNARYRLDEARIYKEKIDFAQRKRNNLQIKKDKLEDYVDKNYTEDYNYYLNNQRNNRRTVIPFRPFTSI